MKPAPFEYLAPASLDEALALLTRYGDEAKLVAGGQSLIPMLRFRLARPGYLIDIGSLKDLRYIREEADGLAVGALTREFELEKSAAVAARVPLLAAAAGLIGHAPIRHRGTVGGSLAHADPAAELPVAALALDAVFKVAGPEGVRLIPAPSFFLSLFTTALQPLEVLAEIRFPYPAPGTGHAFVEMARRAGDFAVVAVAALLTPGPGGTVAAARIALGGVGDVPLRATAAEALLTGQPATSESFAAAAAAAAAETDPPSDLHATAGYRRQVTPVYVKRALAAAWARAGRS